MPISFTGIPSSLAIASAMPPLAVPSSLVRMIPVTPTASPKSLRLADAVLAGGGVDGHQRLVRRVGHLLGDHAADLGQLLHQVRLRVQAAGGVDDDHVGAALAAAGDRVEGDRAGIGALGALDDVDAGALAPSARAARRRRRGTCRPRR